MSIGVEPQVQGIGAPIFILHEDAWESYLEYESDVGGGMKPYNDVRQAMPVFQAIVRLMEQNADLEAKNLILGAAAIEEGTLHAGFKQERDRVVDEINSLKTQHAVMEGQFAAARGRVKQLERENEELKAAHAEITKQGREAAERRKAK